jgi:hypothetical protein
MKNLLFTLCILPWFGSVSPVDPDWIEHYKHQAIQQFPKHMNKMDIITHKVHTYVESKQRENDEELIKVLFMHYLVLCEIHSDLLEE